MAAEAAPGGAPAAAPAADGDRRPSAKSEGSRKGHNSVRAEMFSHVFNVARVDMRKREKREAGVVPLQIAAFIYLDQFVSARDIMPVFIERVVAKLFRFRSIPKEYGGWMYYEEIGLNELNLEYHFQEIDRHIESVTEWEEIVSAWGVRDFDADKPHWQVVSVRKLPCGRPGLVLLVDHALGDGTSLVNMARNMLCDGYQPPQRSSSPATPVITPRRKSVARRMSDQMNGVFSPLLEAFKRSDKANSLKLKPSVSPTGYVFASSPHEISLAKIKEVKNMVKGVTVNDVLLTLVSMSVRDFFDSVDEPVLRKKQGVRTTFVINTRPAKADVLENKWFGNHVVVASMRYPMDKDPLSTLFKVRNSTEYIKNTMDIPMRCFVRDRVLRVVPRSKLPPLTQFINCKYTGTMSNVYLCDTKLSIAGVGIDDMQFATFTPFGTYVGVSTYNGKVSFNFVLAKDLGVNAHELADRVAAQLNLLHARVMTVAAKRGRGSQFGPSAIETAAMSVDAADQSESAPAPAPDAAAALPAGVTA